MFTYHYRGRNSEGESVEGILEANLIADVVRYLNAHGITPVNIKPFQRSVSAVLLQTLKHYLGLNKVSFQDLIIFARQMSTLMAAGVPIISALKQIAANSHSRVLANALRKVARDIVAGQSLAKAMRNYNNIFSPLFISVVEIGENTGHLQQAFLQLTTYLENRMLNRKRFMTAVRYPAAVIVSVFAAMLVMEIFVIPKFADIFGRVSLTLPGPTRLLIFISEVLLHYWGVLLIIVLGLSLVVRYLLVLPQLRYFWDGLKLKFPVLGSLQKRLAVAQFSWSLSIILKAGISIIKGVALAATSLNNSYLRRQVLSIESNVKRGESFTQAARASQFFPAHAIQIIAVGEEAGSLDDMMIEIAKYYDAEVDYDMRQINELLQPLLLLIVGVMVLVLVLGVYLPMWDLVAVARM